MRNQPVSDGTKRAAPLFLGISLFSVRDALMIDALGSAALHPSTPPHSQHSAADVQLKSCIVSDAFVNLEGPLQPIHHVELNHCWVLISQWERRPLCHRGEQSVSGALHDCPVICSV